MISYLLLILAIPLLIYIIKDLISLYHQWYYIKQGFHCYYFPILGGLWIFSRSIGKKDEYAEMSANMQRVIQMKSKEDKTKPVPGSATNASTFFGCLVDVTDPELIREFYLKENEVTQRVPPADCKLSFGFIMEGGEKGLRQRRVFSDFFRTDNLTMMIPIIRGTLREKLAEFTKGSGSSLRNSDEMIKASILKLSTLFMFSTSLDPPYGASGRALSEEMLNLIRLVMSPQVAFSLPNILTWDWISRLNLTAPAKRSKVMANQISERLRQYIRTRQKSLENVTTTTKDTLNIVDSMIIHNNNAPESEKLTENEIIANCNLFLVASYDTTVTSIISILYNLSNQPDLQKIVLEDIRKHGLDKDDLTFADLDKSELLNDIVKEGVRTNTPAPLTFEKRILKDFTLGKYSFRKGDHIVIPIGPLMWNPENFKSGRKFVPGTVNAQNKKTFLPFSGGKRGCVGQFLAEIELKLFTIECLCKGILQPARPQEDVRYVLSLTAQLENAHFTITPRA